MRTADFENWITYGVGKCYALTMKGLRYIIPNFDAVSERKVPIDFFGGNDYQVDLGFRYQNCLCIFDILSVSSYGKIRA